MQSCKRQTRIMWEQEMSVDYKNLLLNILILIKRERNNRLDM